MRKIEFPKAFIKYSNYTFTWVLPIGTEKFTFLSTNGDLVFNYLSQLYTTRQLFPACCLRSGQHDLQW